MNEDKFQRSATPIQRVDSSFSSDMKVDPYNIKDYQTAYAPAGREMLKFASHQYKRFDMTDIYIILGVFLIGFVFAIVLSNYYKIKKEKIDQISMQFKGLQGEFSQVQKSLEKYIRWRYRIKFAEKVYYILLLSLGFLFYKSPSLFAYVFVENPHLSIPFFSLTIILFHLAISYLDRQEKDQEKKHKKLKDKLKDTKRLLLSTMDPLMVQTVKDIIRKDMRKEIEQMRQSDEGCSLKCKLTNEMLKMDLGRNKVIVNELISFKWCDTCKSPQPGAVVQICHAGCGQKVFNRCLPLMKDYGDMEKEIQDLKFKIAEISSQSQKFSDYQKAKKELEFEEAKKSQTFSKFDSPNQFFQIQTPPSSKRQYKDS